MTKTMNNTLLVTGGAGFIGSAVIRNLLARNDSHVVNIDKLTYAGNESTIRSFESYWYIVHISENQ